MAQEHCAHTNRRWISLDIIYRVHHAHAFQSRAAGEETQDYTLLRCCSPENIAFQVVHSKIILLHKGPEVGIISHYSYQYQADAEADTETGHPGESIVPPGMLASPRSVVVLELRCVATEDRDLWWEIVNAGQDSTRATSGFAVKAFCSITVDGQVFKPKSNCLFSGETVTLGLRVDLPTHAEEAKKALSGVGEARSESEGVQGGGVKVVEDGVVDAGVSVPLRPASKFSMRRRKSMPLDAARPECPDARRRRGRLAVARGSYDAEGDQRGEEGGRARNDERQFCEHGHDTGMTDIGHTQRNFDLEKTALEELAYRKTAKVDDRPIKRNQRERPGKKVTRKKSKDVSQSKDGRALEEAIRAAMEIMPPDVVVGTMPLGATTETMSSVAAKELPRYHRTSRPTSAEEHNRKFSVDDAAMQRHLLHGHVERLAEQRSVHIVRQRIKIMIVRQPRCARPATSFGIKPKSD
ncbi:hypothetical protein EV121DRAFT_274802 [Schizophyllum commune]